MDRKSAEQFRKEILLGMCTCAESVHDYFLRDRPNLFGIAFDSECPNAFKPGTSDKLIFMRIIDEYFEGTEIHIDSFTGTKLMACEYYPKYGDWKKYPKAVVQKLRED